MFVFIRSFAVRGNLFSVLRECVSSVVGAVTSLFTRVLEG